ncbi:hypothetical protein [Arthrobacter sp. PsM3]|uniref:hypothetical protein n=1 Tax=Arthrobacter sp. PsM3 TaxID=3030531 RepID=UPI00263B71C3|nr:hypothetical protein [Arthrobacter sp. PsM3]MDN4643916.1 hypothetical protein [Arthrobacter sp. PsM3]
MADLSGSTLDRYAAGGTYYSAADITPFYKDPGVNFLGEYPPANWTRAWTGMTIAAAALSLAVVPSTPVFAAPEVGRPTETRVVKTGADYLPTLIASGTSALTRVETPGIESTSRARNSESIESVRAERDRRVAAASVSAVDDLGEWLQLTDTQVAQLCNISRRTLGNWRNAGGAYGASSRHLLAVHAFVSQLVAAQGVERTRLWLAMSSDEGTDRLARLSQGADGLRNVLTLAEPLLFPASAPAKKLVDDDDLDAYGEPPFDASTQKAHQSPAAGFVARPVRPRNT